MEIAIILPFLYIFVLVLGFILGSFLNSWIWRTRENIKIFTFSRSICINCRRTLCWYENVPVLSFLFLRGRCRTCRQPIPAHYPLVELFSAASLVLVFWYHVQYINPFSPPHFLRDVFFLSFLIVIFVYDALYQIILSRIVWPAALIGFWFNYFYLGLSLSSMFWGALAAGGFFLLQYLISRGRWIGGGDVRLGVMMGVWLGFPGVLIALGLAYVVGALFGIGLLIFKKSQLQSELPFGVFLAIGTFFAMFHATEVVNWYLNLLRF